MFRVGSLGEASGPPGTSSQAKPHCDALRSNDALRRSEQQMGRQLLAKHEMPGGGMIAFARQKWHCKPTGGYLADRSLTRAYEGER